MINEALQYAKKGWPIIPVQGKAPLTEHAFKEASINATQIKQWWKTWPSANVAIKTGSESGIIVLDIDPRNGGFSSLSDLPSLPLTLKVRSGGGGVHYYFKHPGFEVRGRIGMRPGLDVKADGGGIVAPPSIHPDTKKAYEWESSPQDTMLSPVPDWLLKMIVTKNKPDPRIAKHLPPATLKSPYFEKYKNRYKNKYR